MKLLISKAQQWSSAWLNQTRTKIENVAEQESFTLAQVIRGWMV